MCGEVIGRSSHWGGNEHAVADQFGDPHLVVNENAYLRGLARLAQKRNFVEGDHVGDFTGTRGRVHAKRMHLSGFRCFKARLQSRFTEFVHQKTDGAEVHAVNRLFLAEKGVKRLQHEAVAAEGDDDFRLRRPGIAILLAHERQGALGIGSVRGDEVEGMRHSFNRRSATCGARARDAHGGGR